MPVIATMPPYNQRIEHCYVSANIKGSMLSENEAAEALSGMEKGENEQNEAGDAAPPDPQPTGAKMRHNLAHVSLPCLQQDCSIVMVMVLILFYEFGHQL